MFLLLLLLPVVSARGETSLSEHWSRPVVASGPTSLGYVDTSRLYPESCAECHPDRHREWSGSLHSKSVGPGLLGQLDADAEPGLASSCYLCHAPAVEQSEVLESGAGFDKNPAFDRRFKESGVSCAVCHVRMGTVYGPGGSAPASSSHDKGRAPLHGESRGFFKRAEFCAACHQMDGGYRLNGKVLTNTYREWKESSYGRNGVTCQVCHMPEGRHLFRGIHDPAMVKDAVRIEVYGGKTSARIKLTNSGAGHYFPTYVTPLVVVRGFVVDKEGLKKERTEREVYIGRGVTLDLTRELFDTRIPPGKSFVYDYTQPEATAVGDGDRIVFEVWVYPDRFYRDFFIESLKGGNFTSRSDMEQALAAAEGSPYLLYREEVR